MIAEVHQPIHKSPSAVVVSVTGGQATSALVGSEQITDEDFAKALRQSIEQSKLFARALREGPATYQLQVWIARINRQFRANWIVSMEVNYVLMRTTDQQVVWQKAVLSNYKSMVGPGFGAARENIEQAIQEISQLRLE
ncbi:MAG: hypothetical protein HP493_13740 [Nitrospira sp.]|nr:hypothetical protein [Nitrospira sp.]